MGRLTRRHRTGLQKATYGKETIYGLVYVSFLSKICEKKICLVGNLSLFEPGGSIDCDKKWLPFKNFSRAHSFAMIFILAII